MAIKTIRYKNREYKVAYEIRNQQIEPYVLILHGWGASKELMIKAFSKNITKYRQIYIDLPGFGGSNIIEPFSTKDYANICHIFIEELGLYPKIVMGHSFGGKIATLLGPSNLVLLSSAGIIEEKSSTVKIKIALFKFLKLFGLGRFYRLFATKDVAGMSRVVYDTLKIVINEDFTKEFCKFEGEALIFWGKEDSATKLQSGEKIHKLIKNSKFYPLDGDHFFFLMHSKFIGKMIDEWQTQAELGDRGDLNFKDGNSDMELLIDEALSEADTSKEKEILGEDKLEDKLEDKVEEATKSPTTEDNQNSNQVTIDGLKVEIGDEEHFKFSEIYNYKLSKLLDKIKEKKE